jgi:HlyD family secretion protein
MSKKLILIVVVGVAVLGFGLYWFLFREKKPEFIFQKVTKGTVVQDVSETGSVKVSEETALGFKNSGRIKKIHVNVGDNIRTGQALAELDTTQLEIELSADRADLEVVKAKKNDAEVSLKNAEQSLKNAQASAEEKLKSVYEDAINVLDDSYLKIYNSFSAASDIYRDYFSSNDQQGRKVADSKNKIETAMNFAKSYVDDAANDFQNEKIDEGLSKVKTALENTRDALGVIRDMAETITYRNVVSSSDKTSLDSQKSHIIAALNSLTNAQQTISAAKVSNKTNINNAEAKISSLKNQLREGGLYSAQANQVRAEIKLLENKIAEAVLKSPGKGQITNINKREGEVVQPTDSVVSFLPAGPFQIEVDIYEEDIVKVKIGEPVDITLTAFPDQILKGKVFSIDPAEKLIEGVVYYKVTINFLELKKGIKPGMTADITIRAAKKDDVLLVPKEAVEDIDGQRTVQIRKNGEIETRKIETGLEGEDFFEVVSGLKEGEEVVTGKKT